MADKANKIDPKLVDELLKGQDPQKVLSSEGLLGDLKKALAERMLDAEMDVHLASEEEQAPGIPSGNAARLRVAWQYFARPASLSV